MSYMKILNISYKKIMTKNVYLPSATSYEDSQKRFSHNK